MTISQPQIEAELKAGFNVFCATCEHLHDGKAKGLSNCDKTLCGGPITNNDFPDYKGVIPRERFRDICLLCGDPAPYLGIYTHGEHKFSLCYKDRKAIQVFPSITGVTYKPIVVPL